MAKQTEKERAHREKFERDFPGWVNARPVPPEIEQRNGWGDPRPSPPPPRGLYHDLDD